MGAAGGGFASKEALASTPKEALRAKIWLVALWASCCGGLHGMNTSNISGIMTMKPFVQDFGLGKLSASGLSNLTGWVTSAMLLGQLCGVFFAGFVTERFGRKVGILTGAVWYTIGTILMSANWGSVTQLLVGRVCSGLGSGFGMSVGAIYIAEIAPKAVRGTMSTLYNVNIMSGVTGAYWINYWALLHLPKTSPWQWRAPMILQIFPAACLFLGLCVFPESPRYLALKNRIDEAKKVLLELRGIPEHHPYFQEEFTELITRVQTDSETEKGFQAIKMLFKICRQDPSTRKRLVFVLVIQTFFIMSGGNSITYYAPTILKSMHLNSQQVLLFTAIYGMVKVVSVFLYAFFLTDRFGRRPLLLIGATINMLCLIYLAGYLGVSEHHPSKGPTGASWMAIVSICIFAIGYGFGWAPAFSLSTSEVCNTRTRTPLVTIAFVYQNLLNFLITRFFPNMTEGMHPFGPFALFAAFTCLGILWVYLAFPECKGRSMETMDQLFMGPWYKVARRQKRMARSEAGMEAEEGRLEDKIVIEHLEKGG